MDPSLDFVTVQSSFKQSPQKWSKKLLPPEYRNDKTVKSVQPSIQVSNIDNLPPIYCDTKKYQTLVKLQDKFSDLTNSTYLEARDNTLPINDLGKSIFKNRAAIKLANLDALYNLSLTNQNYKDLQDNDPFWFCDIAAGPGSFSQYLMWRKLQSRGYGFTYYHENDAERRNWDLTILGNRFEYTYGNDGTGNLYTQWSSFVQFVQERTTVVNLVTGDGGFDIEDNKDLYKQEFISSRLLLTQILTAISLLSPGGNFACKIFDTVTALSAQLLYICTLCFESLSVVKPISSRWANAERYFVAKNFKNNAGPYIDLLNEANNKYTTTENIVQLFSSPLPDSFIKWMNQHNDTSTDLRLDSSKKIIDYVKLTTNQKVSYIPQPQLNLTKCFIIWNIPSNKGIVDTKSLVNIYNQYTRTNEVQKWFKGNEGTDMHVWADWLILQHSFNPETDLYLPITISEDIKSYLITRLTSTLGTKQTATVFVDEWTKIAHDSVDLTYHHFNYLKTYTKNIHDVVRLTTKDVSLDLHKNVYNNLKLRYVYKDKDIEQQIWALVSNYQFLGYPPYQRSFIGSYIKLFKEQLDVKTEWFASPLNTYYDNYYSLFETDKYFGSLGNIFDIPNNTLFKGWHHVFPPPILMLVTQLLSKIKDALTVASKAKEDLGIILVLPSSIDIAVLSKTSFFQDKLIIDQKSQIFCIDGYNKQPYGEDVTISFLSTYKIINLRDIIIKLKCLA